MAKYEITHTCGHVATHDIVGTNVNDERARKAEWLSGKPCLECDRAAKAAARKAAAAEATATTADMIALKGSDKQVAWATTIRATARAAVEKTLAGAKLNDAQTAAINALWAQADAGWWIDNRANGDIAMGWLREASKLAR